MPISDFDHQRLDNLDERIQNVLNYIRENPESDPNAYEMNDIMFDFENTRVDIEKNLTVYKKRTFHSEVAPNETLYTKLKKLIEKKEQITEEEPEEVKEDNIGKEVNPKQTIFNDEHHNKVNHDFSAMMKYRIEQLKEFEAQTNSTGKHSLSNYFQESIDNSRTICGLGDNTFKNISSKACAISLFVKQRLRDLEKQGSDEPVYDNSKELSDLLTDIENYQNNGDKEDYNYRKNMIAKIQPLVEEAHFALNKTPEQYRQCQKELEEQEIEDPDDISI